MLKRTRTAIPNSQKAALRAQHHLKPYLSHSQLQAWYKEAYKQKINLSSISRILSKEYAFLDTIENHHLINKRRRTEHWPELEEALFEWIQQAEVQITISQEVIREKAKQFWPSIYPEKEMPQFSNGWIRNFQSRRDIRRRAKHGEAGSISEDASTEMIGIRKALSLFAPQDIFNCDESALYWKMPPDQGLSSRNLPGQKEKARITAHFCCNSDASERLPIWIIGSAKRPRAFSAAGINPENLGIIWRSNKKAWMTGAIFKEWLFWFDSKMKGRKVALLMDNFSAHEAAAEDIQLQNTIIIWLPANSTSRYQPLDQGIIRIWKAYWKRQWMLYMMTQFDRGLDPVSTITILQALRWAIPAWELDLKDTTIQHCFRKALHIEEVAEIEEREVIKQIEQGIQKMQLSNYIKEAMDINQFISPADEEVNDNLLELDEMILGQYTVDQQDEEEDDDTAEPLPQIPPADALECLYKLRLYEEQQIDADKALIKTFMQYERVILKRKIESLRQGDIRQFFG
jgi:hypothetical protein